MKSIFSLSLTFLLLTSPAIADEMRASLSAKTEKSSVTAETFKDIKATLGIVPSMFKVLPESCVAGAWSEFKSIQLGDQTALKGKQKELIGLGVASQIPCTYCTTFHTQAARFHGATDEEIREAIAVAALDRHWSTYLNGSQEDFGEFKKFTDDFVALTKERSAGNKPHEVSFNTDAKTSEEAYAEIEKTFGQVPGFFRKFPQAGITGAWNHLKRLMFNRDTALSAKDRNLISLAVAAQTPCQYCTYFDNQGARLEGATDQEISEAVTMASIVRHWSTILNGNAIPEGQFENELKQVFRYLKKTAKA